MQQVRNFMPTKYDAWLVPLIITIGMLFSMSTVFAADADVSLPDVNANIGDTATIEGTILCSVPSCDAMDITLGFDPSIIRVDAARLGSYWGSTGNTPFPVANTIDNTAGTVNLAVATLNAGSPPTTGTGIAFELDITVLASGVSPLSVNALQIGDLQGTSIGASGIAGSVTVAADPTVAQLRASVATNNVAIGEALAVDLVLDNPDMVNGGGIFSLDADCSLTVAGIVQGQSVQSTGLFAPDPVVISNGFVGDTVRYAVSQTQENPAITTGGTVATLNFTALATGETTLNCNVTIVDGTNAETTLAYQSIALIVEELTPDAGIVTGTVLKSHSPTGGVVINVVDASGTTVATGTTEASGVFTISNILAGDYTVEASYPGYLPARGSLTIVATQTTTKATVTLVAGELNTSEPIVIDELDLVELAVLSYGQSVPPASPSADFNSDTTVSIADLRALAEGWRTMGPLNWD